MASPPASLNPRLSPPSLSPYVWPFRFEKLPPELLREIFSRLDYKSLISLSSTNRFLHEMVDPQIAPIESKFSFVMHAENYFSKHFPGIVQGQEHPGNHACYICFRVRSPAHFDAEQPHTIYLDDKGQRIRDGVKGWGGGGAAIDGSDSRTDDVRRKARAKVTLRRFCIECGVKKRLHLPGDLLVTKLRQELWVCNCLVVWQKPSCLKCTHCGGDCPLRPRNKA